MIRNGADEARSPKYAHVERERRWLIDEAHGPGSEDPGAVAIEDRYIVGTRLRVRRMQDSSGKVARKITKKYGSDDPLARAIVTTYLDEDEYALVAALPGLPLVKRRLPLAAHGIVYSVDLFAGPLDGLVLAEIEWPDDAGLRALPPPPGAIREVSDDIRYQGGSLAAYGIPKD